MSLQRPSVFTWPHGQWERRRYTITQYFWCVNISANAPLSPKEGFGAAVCIRLRAPRAPLRRQGWGNIPLLRRGDSISSLPALTQSTGGCRGEAVRCGLPRPEEWVHGHVPAPRPLPKRAAARTTALLPAPSLRCSGRLQGLSRGWAGQKGTKAMQIQKSSFSARTHI